MTERDIPDNWSPGRARESNHQGNLPLDGAAAGSTSKSVKKRKKKDTSGFINKDSKVTAAFNQLAERMPRWMKSWVLWSVILTLIPGSTAFLAVSMLLKLPSAPNCPEIFWPLASASVRLHCAQLAASKQTVSDLLQAIALVKELPSNHPLRTQIDGLLEDWSRDILQLADESFQAGNLEEAIATARQVPEDLKAHELVDEQISKWQRIWTRAEKIYQDAENELRQRNWQSAFMLTAKLLRVNNKYWSSTKYDQLNRIIVTAREDGDKLYKAENLARSGSVENVLKAMKIAESIQRDSYMYQKAQELIPKFGSKMLKLAQARMDRRDADTALDIVRKIPPIPSLQAQIDDFIVLGEAQRSAFIGTVAGLEAAISQAQQIDASRDIYDKAQQLIARWQLEIGDVGRLEKARTLASQGTINDLTAAISEAEQIPSQNPRGQEAQQEMGRWRYQVESIEDRPYLDRADQIAMMEDINSLQAAIAEARQIRSGRALYPEARRKISQWTAKIQLIQDRPILDNANALADSGDLAGAINAAKTISGSGRVLAGEAQTAINGWEEQLSAKDNWRKAQESASIGTPDALARAIRLANRISTNNILRMDANVAIDGWSQQLLQIARSQGESDIPTAINTAKLIPRGSSAYADAQAQINTWQQFLSPPTTPSTSEPTPSSEGL
jgi:hypothetical protein